jgi:hypothetical protein
VLPDAAGEDQRVEPVHGGRHRGDARAEPVQIDVEREPRVVVRAPQQLAHVARAGEPGQSRAVLERVLELGGAHAPALDEPQQQPRVDASRP